MAASGSRTGFADSEFCLCTSLRFVGLRGLRPILGLRPLRHGQMVEWPYGYFDDRSWQRESVGVVLARSPFDEPAEETEASRREDDVEDEHELEVIAELAECGPFEELARRRYGATQGRGEER